METLRKPAQAWKKPPLVISVYRNNDSFAEVVIADGDWTVSGPVPNIVQSEIVLAYCLGQRLLGSAKIAGDTYSWGKEAE